MVKEREMAFCGFEKDRNCWNTSVWRRTTDTNAGIGSISGPLGSLHLDRREPPNIRPGRAVELPGGTFLQYTLCAGKDQQPHRYVLWILSDNTIRGLREMSLMVTISLLLMLAVAVCRTVEKQPELIQSGEHRIAVA